MQLKSIKVANARQSKTNVKGRIEGNEFEDLVASIKEKGVLVPVLARIEKKAGKEYYEIVAGNRRLMAAKKAGIKEIPAQIIAMNDVEAREAQIIENLQRKDLHPLDEGEAYRQLIEKSKFEIVTIAANVGKNESYIKQRLYLTNLESKPAEAYRAEKINDGHAVLIAKLSSGDQLLALKEVNSGWSKLTVKELKEWIQREIYSNLNHQPWINKKELEEAVGACVECKPNRATLFGDIKEGACTNLKCCTRKMGKYLNYVAKKEKRKKVSDEYGTSEKGILSLSDYGIVKKDECDNVRAAIIVQGSSLGKKLNICFDKECKTHGGSQSNCYSKTPAEKAAAKKERKQNAKEKLAREEKLKNALQKIKWPITEKHLKALLDLALEEAGSNTMRTVAKRHELEVKKEKGEWGSTFYDYKKAVLKLVQKMTKVEKIKMVFELLIDTGEGYLRKGINKL